MEEISRITRIGEMIADPDEDLSEISRLIALEQVEVVKKMALRGTPASLMTGSFTSKDLNDHLKGLRELQRTLMESDQLSKRDVLNLDGPKFRFVFSELVKTFQRALKESGLSEELVQNCMLQFGDLIKTNDENLRRDLSKVEGGR